MSRASHLDDPTVATYSNPEPRPAVPGLDRRRAVELACRALSYSRVPDPLESPAACLNVCGIADYALSHNSARFGKLWDEAMEDHPELPSWNELAPEAKEAAVVRSAAAHWFADKSLLDEGDWEQRILGNVDAPGLSSYLVHLPDTLER